MLPAVKEGKDVKEQNSPLLGFLSRPSPFIYNILRDTMA